MTQYAPIPRPTSDPSFLPAHVAITLRLADGGDDLFVRHIRLLRDCVALAQQRWQFDILAAVVLPNEIQLLCAFPDAEFGVNGAIRVVQSGFARHVPGGSIDLWSEASEVIEIAPAVVELRQEFMEAAPVRLGLVKRAQDWPFSSAHKGELQGTDMGVAVA